MANNSLWFKFLPQYQEDSKGNKDNHDGKENKDKDKDKKLFSSVSNSKLEILRICLITILAILSIALLENHLKEVEVKTPVQAENKDERCTYDFKFSTITCLTNSSKLLNQVQNFGVLSAAFLFFIDTRNRKKQLELQAWQLLDSAEDIKTSYARKQALEVLSQEGRDIKGFIFDNMDLEGINLTGTNLTKASFKKAILNEAILKKATLYCTDFQEAELEKANLNHAYLYLANLEKANLHESRLENAVLNGANFKEATLRKANLQGANLQGANLQGANLLSANLENANLENTDLQNVKNLTLSQVKKAKNWQKAIYDEGIFPEETQLIRKKVSKQENCSQIISNLRNTNAVIKEIDKAIKIIDEENPEAKSSQLYQTLLEVRDKVNNLIDNSENYDISKTEKIKDKLAKIEETQKKLEEAQKYDKIAGEWLAKKQDDIISIINNNQRLSLNDNILNSSDKIEYFYHEVNQLLEVFISSVSKSQKPKQIYDGTIKLEFPKIIYRDIFVIVEQVIREMKDTEENQLDKKAFNRLINFYLKDFIKWLEQ